MRDSYGGANPGVVPSQGRSTNVVTLSNTTRAVKRPPDPPPSSLTGSPVSLSTMDQRTFISGPAPKFLTDSDSNQRSSSKNLIKKNISKRGPF